MGSGGITNVDEKVMCIVRGTPKTNHDINDDSTQCKHQKIVSGAHFL